MLCHALLLQVLKEGRLKNILTHIKKHGAPPDAAEAAEEAAAAAAKLHLAEVSRPYKLLPVDKEAKLDVFVHAGVKGECAAGVGREVMGFRGQGVLYTCLGCANCNGHDAYKTARTAAWCITA
jgi:hypothetical protein